MSEFQSITQMSAALQQGKISSRELTQQHLDGATAGNQALNCFISINAEAALAQADYADSLIADGSAGPMTGIPMAHKDIFCTQGIATTCASKMLENFTAPYNATVVEKLNKAGMVCIGKTNMDEFAMGSSNETSHFGAVSNPWDLDRVPGGSSGGSAAAIAAGLGPLATGTDTGGSIRQPSALCGITGLKPTYGRVSRFGLIAFASSLDQGGPMARSADDVARLLGLMAGFDAKDSTSAQRNDDWQRHLTRDGAPKMEEQLTIGLPEEYFVGEAHQAVYQSLQRELESLGHRLVPVKMPHTGAAVPAYYVIASAEASTNLSRYDGVRFGHRCTNPDSLQDLYERSRSEGFGEEVKRRILTGTYALSVGYFDAYYIKAQKIRRLIVQDFEHAFTQVDVLLTPTAPTTAFAKNQHVADPTAMYHQDLFTVPTSLAGLPALSMPCGFSQGLPLGAQIIAPAFREDLALGLAAQYQQQSDWHLQRPEFQT